MSGKPLGSRVASGFALSLTNNIGLRLVGVVLSVVVARLLAPEDFGAYAVGLTVLMILATLADFGTSAYLVRSASFNDRAPTVATVGILIGAGLALLMWLTSGPIAGAFGSPSSQPVLQLLSLSLVVSGAGVVPAAILQREFLQGRQLVADAANLVVFGSTTVSLLLADVGPMSLAWGRLTGVLVGVLLQFRLSGARPRFGFRRDYLPDIARFGLPLAGANFVSWLLLSIDAFVIGRTLGPVALGYYVLAFNVSTWPISAVGQSVRVIALPAFARDRRRDALVPAAGLTWSLALPVGVLISVLAIPLVHLLYGARWAPSADALVVLGLFGTLRVMFDLFATYLIARSEPRKVFAIQILWFIALVPAIYIGVRAFDFAGAAWAHLAVGLSVVLPSYLVCLRRLDVPIKALVRNAVAPVTAIVPAVLVAALSARSIEAPFLALMLGSLVFVTIYLPLLARWMRHQFALVKDTTDADDWTAHSPDRAVAAGARDGS